MATYDPLNTKSLSIYVDGYLVGSIQSSDCSQSHDIEHLANYGYPKEVAFLACNYHTGGDVGMPFHGFIDELYIWDDVKDPTFAWVMATQE